MRELARTEQKRTPAQVERADLELSPWITVLGSGALATARGKARTAGSASASGGPSAALLSRFSLGRSAQKVGGAGGGEP